MRVRIGPFDFEIDGDDATLDALARPFEHYRVAEAVEAPFRLHARCGDPPPLPTREGALRITEPGFALAYRENEAWLHYRAPEPNALEVPLHVGFMHVLALHAIDHDALLTHASAIRLDGKGLVFVGRSGAGKSTLASWFPPEDVLNDDYVVLHRTAPGERWVSSQPLFGSAMVERVGRPISAEIRALYRLGHANTAKVTLLRAADALPVLMASVAVPEPAGQHQGRAFGLASQWAAANWRHLSFPLDAKETSSVLRET